MNDVQKFKADDKVWVFHNKEKVVEAAITYVKHEDRGHINYHLKCPDAKDLTWEWSGFCFATKEECIDHWIKRYEDLMCTRTSRSRSTKATSRTTKMTSLSPGSTGELRRMRLQGSGNGPRRKFGNASLKGSTTRSGTVHGSSVA